MSSFPMYSSVPCQNVQGPVSHAQWPPADSFCPPASSSPWEVDESTAQAIGNINSVFGFRPPTAHAKSPLPTSPNAMSSYSPDLPPLHSDRLPDLRQDSPSDARTRTSSFGPETPPTQSGSCFSSEPLVQPLTPAQTSRHPHSRSHSDACSPQGALCSESHFRVGSETTFAHSHDAKQHSCHDLMSRPEEHRPGKQRREMSSPHQDYAVAFTRSNRAVTLILTAGRPANSRQANITCYRQTWLPPGGPFADFFEASEALSLLQHMVNASSMIHQPFSRRERSELMLLMRTCGEGMVLGSPGSNTRAWTSFFSAELGAGRVWEVGTVIFPWRVLERLMSSLNAECARKRRTQARAAAAAASASAAAGCGSRREVDEYSVVQDFISPQNDYERCPDSQPGSMQLSSEGDVWSAPMSGVVVGDGRSIGSASPPPWTPMGVLRPKLRLVSKRRPEAPPEHVRVRRQRPEPVLPLSLKPPRITLLKSKICRQSLRGLHSASTLARLEFYDSIREWPASSDHARVRLPPCARFLEMVGE